MDRLSRLNHQGVIAITSAIDFYEAASLVDHVLFRGENPGLCICDGITDVRNFGAIARSAEVFGIHGLIIGQKIVLQLILNLLKHLQERYFLCQFAEKKIYCIP